MTRHAFTIVETIMAVGIALLLITVLTTLLLHGGSTTARTSAQFSLQQTSRVAIARLLQELQEGIEVVVPGPGVTLPHAVVRDRVSCARWYYLVAQAGEPGSYELWRQAADPDLPAAQRKERLLKGVRRLTFTARGEAALQVNLLVREAGEEMPLLTTVRLRNVAAADEGW